MSISAAFILQLLTSSNVTCMFFLAKNINHYLSVRVRTITPALYHLILDLAFPRARCLSRSYSAQDISDFPCLRRNANLRLSVARLVTSGELHRDTSDLPSDAKQSPGSGWGQNEIHLQIPTTDFDVPRTARCAAFADASNPRKRNSPDIPFNPSVSRRPRQVHSSFEVMHGPPTSDMSYRRPPPRSRFKFWIPRSREPSYGFSGAARRSRAITASSTRRSPDL
ncbi:hypothetical protein DFH09DRAFT_1335679 [Mycena vulgaris]|nr:hypothetical protein DFH09DRAFT_1335679 [Mycena vulgaris]